MIHVTEKSKKKKVEMTEAMCHSPLGSSCPFLLEKQPVCQLLCTAVGGHHDLVRFHLNSEFHMCRSTMYGPLRKLKKKSDFSHFAVVLPRYISKAASVNDPTSLITHLVFSVNAGVQKKKENKKKK